MLPVLTISKLSKTYGTGFQALKSVDLTINRGEVFALLGPNGAGKTTLIGIVCGIVRATSGTVTVDGHDNVRDYRRARAKIGLVPQELTVDGFITVWDAVSFSRGLFGKKPDPAYLERMLRSLTLWDRKDSKIITLSGGMKRRVLIAKALAHEPEILFLDEPTAGVDVELRREMWTVMEQLKQSGVTIILTTHYIDEAEEMADRVGVINKGEIVLVESKVALMTNLGRKELTLQLGQPLAAIPAALGAHRLQLSDSHTQLIYTYDSENGPAGITALFDDLAAAGIRFSDLSTSERSLEEIFVSVVHDGDTARKRQTA
ncbi:MAG: ABC transporter ATP-binding protein [Ancalomicrobiaceae bacterium]|nr:ABC transporter ATP-binding protein [Ancalomicrobiaceae bacterium]